MASFIGTFDEFIKYINPRAKNVVNAITKTHKLGKGKCEHCGSTTETLEAAHVAGRERPKIIEEILDEFRNGEMITVDLEVFENLFLQAHEPIEQVILVLCRKCHNEYDLKQSEIVTLDVDVDVEYEAYADTTIMADSQLMTNSQITDAIRRVVPRLTDEQVEELKDPNYCKSTFLINYSVLKEIPIYSNQESIRKLAQVNGHNRWSTQRPIIRNGACFLVTTQWTNRHRFHFKIWFDQVSA
tara:strand:+ start:601 stop:1326 length:726 start_codon:yes stop_codon:yes gene_type:complete